MIGQMINLILYSSEKDNQGITYCFFKNIFILASKVTQMGTFFLYISCIHS